MIPKLTLGKHQLDIPIIQGGMGVGVSLSNLAGHVMLEGGMGVISAAHPGYRKENFLKDSCGCNVEAIKEEISKARAIAQGKGLCGVNIMVASHHYEEYVKAAVEGGADAIISGAGIPLQLPGIVGDADILLAPIVSSGKVARLILKAWDRHFHRLPDFIVIEGSEAGGHLGFSLEQLQLHTAQSLAEILVDVQAVVQPYEEQSNCRIPLIVAGGIYTSQDMKAMLDLGASGVQMATRFIATHECDADDAFKQMFVNAKEADMALVKSPAGLPGRAILNPFMQATIEKRVPAKHCIGCMKPCIPATTPYCISEALIHAVKGELDEGLVFAGSNAYRIDKIVHVSELIDEVMSEWR